MNWSDHLANLNGGEILYGAQTAQALTNFPLAGPRLSDRPELVKAVAAVKIAAARANVALGELDETRGRAIVAAGEEVRAGRHLGQFVLPVVQGGGGTSTNMNVNEVLAARASQLSGVVVHPNDHVNRGQSTNDVMPTAIAIAVIPLIDQALVGLRRVAESLENKAIEYDALVHLGRTCLQDAVPIPVADFHRGQAASVGPAMDALVAAATELYAVPLGGTAVGTGLGTAPGFAEAALEELTALTGLALTIAPSPSYSLASLEPLTAVSEAASRAGRVLARIARDLRLLASGPVGGIGEVELPAVQAGSSIMPGKVNPVIPELVMQVSFLLNGATAAARSATEVGELEVSAMAPVVTLGLLDGLTNLHRVSEVFAGRCITGLRWREDAVARNLAGSLESAVLTATTDGYESAARSVQR
ncbi:lyase family protein [Kribbella speibonae]|uniref:Aspartate ammonia-lyase n=1 Tax=Kribbella speibonae TaxID=1572660 RepID=A0A4R0ISY8_9ACTN|nr:lyase family protein [Kribbella speibonae]TCC26961.1 aspartate ammonia-lyase [Kribbella speibonae]TCC36187.1 aspartate ammonia-lyase [Kribbella speibonae]